ncbi:hypothetical protein [Rhizobium leguminosarum]|uniref:hypothetical protein n=1 Tax=Rhizobium leguminosarum TaxID=384 RepID=UPI0010E95FAE|nr:hypothetical protein [Rhizobium leguminosarum]TCA08583.1 hypothetical protein E0H63_07180 [Rhizobium leguminosarum bv. viciae]
MVDITTSKAALAKSLEFANELFNALEIAGHRVVLAPSGERFSRAKIDEREMADKSRDPYHRGPWSPARPTLVYIGTVPIGLAIVELSEQVLMRYVGDGKYIRDADYAPPKRARYANDYNWTTTKEIPSGRLKLVAYCPYYKVSWSAEWKETKNTPLEKTLLAIVTAVASSAVDLAVKLEEADRQAEIDRLAWEAEREKQRRQQDRRQIEQSVRESHENLSKIIQQWSELMSVEAFLTGVEQRASELDDAVKKRVLDRLSLARNFLGSQNPLDFFLSWKTPTERYQPKYDHDGKTS